MSNKDLASEYFDAVWSEHYDPVKIRELTTPNLVFRYPMHGELHGPEAVITILDSFRESLPDLKFWATDELLEAGDYVIARWEGAFDDERAKVVSDLLGTGAVKSLTLTETKTAVLVLGAALE